MPSGAHQAGFNARLTVLMPTVTPVGATLTFIVGLGAIAVLRPGDLWTRLWPRPLPDRLRKLEESDLASRIDNSSIYDNERFWWHECVWTCLLPVLMCSGSSPC